ncbi:MAG TPA: alpha/beta hydrolase-fold protein [Polyangiaceae bacterium]|nr:alpha/beta hydrolase-fold protein [Polyangiaceae bacterium]
MRRPSEAIGSSVVSTPSPARPETPGKVAQPPSGIYALTQASRPVPAAILADARVRGVVVRTGWQEVEPTEGNYDTGYLSAELSRVAGTGKVGSLVVTSGGRATPRWLQAKGLGTLPFVDENRYHASHGETLTIPVFWDPQLLAAKKKLIEALGARLSSQPGLLLVSAQCANATTDDWNIPRSPEAIAAWKSLGYSDDKLLSACKQIVDTTMQAFPKQIVRMAVGRVPPELTTRPDGVVSDLVRYASERYPGRFIVQRHNLAAVTPRPDAANLFGWEVIRDAQPHAAGQFLWPATDTKSCRLDRGTAPCRAEDMFARAVDVALAYRLRYVEVYGADLLAPELNTELDRLARGLTGTAGPDKSPAAAAGAVQPERQARAPGRGPASTGDAQTVSFQGERSRRAVEFTVVLPQGYGTRRYPVIYWLHGKGGTPQRSAHVARYLQEAVQTGAVPDSIMIFPTGGLDSFYTDKPDGSWPVETMIIEDLLPYVDAHYKTVATRQGRLLMGFSMGGFGALKFAAKYPERFGAVVAYGAPRLDASMGMRGPDATIFRDVFDQDMQRFEQNTPVYLFRKNAARVLEHHLRVRLVAGSQDGTRHSVLKLHEALVNLGIPHEYEVLDGVNHVVSQYYTTERGKGFAFLGKGLTAAPATP